MPKKKYIVTLTTEERSQLEALTRKGKAAAYKVNHARILLLADSNRVEGGSSGQSHKPSFKSKCGDD